jgi:UDP-glucose 4-epimerase
VSGDLAGKKVLVTGACGFIGSHLVERLVTLGARVRAFHLYSARGHRGWLDDLPSEVTADLEAVAGDVRDRGQVAQACEGMDVVLHLAAQISIPFSYVAPETFLDTNVRGTLNVLEATREGRCGRLVHTSTSEVYGTPDEVPIREDHALKGQSPYSATKIAADKLCEAYARSYETPVMVLRPFNTYGPRQSARAVLPTILSQLLAGARVVRLGSLEPRRDLTFVGDTVEGFAAAAGGAWEPGETIHLGTGRACSVGELFQACCEAVGVEAEIEVDPARVRPSASEVQVLLSDPARAAERLGWEARVSLVDGLARTAAWIREHPGEFRAGEYLV